MKYVICPGDLGAKFSENYATASLSHLRTMLPERSSRPRLLHAKWPNHNNLVLFRFEIPVYEQSPSLATATSRLEMGSLLYNFEAAAA